MRPTTFLFMLLFLSSIVWAGEPPTDPAALKVHIMETTKVVAVMDIEGGSADFKDDGDPDTLEMVFLSKKSDGPSRVSPDGQIIFLYKASEKLQSKLIEQAFDLRVASKLGGS